MAHASGHQAINNKGSTKTVNEMVKVHKHVRQVRNMKERGKMITGMVKVN